VYDYTFSSLFSRVCILNVKSISHKRTPDSRKPPFLFRFFKFFFDNIGLAIFVIRYHWGLMVLSNCLCCIAMERYSNEQRVLIVKTLITRMVNITRRLYGNSVQFFGITMHRTDQLFVGWSGNLKEVVPHKTTKSLDALEVAGVRRMLPLCTVLLLWVQENRVAVLLKKCTCRPATMYGSQQDGATRHTSRETVVLVREKFPDRLISFRGDRTYSPRSCDFTPCDFFLIGIH